MRSTISRRSFLLLSGAFLLALAVAAFFATRFLVHTLRWATHRDEPIEDWMWIGYVARSHRVDPKALLAALGLPTDTGDRRTLGEIARQQNTRFEDVRALLEAAIAQEKQVDETPAARKEP